jgi:hypothetical protein
MSAYIALAGRQALFAAIVVASVLIGIGTWTRVGTPTPTSALAGSTVDPSAMMTDAMGPATSHYDDHSLVFN